MLMLLSVHVTSVLFLVRFNNFTLTKELHALTLVARSYAFLLGTRISDTDTNCYAPNNLTLWTPFTSQELARRLQEEEQKRASASQKVRSSPPYFCWPCAPVDTVDSSNHTKLPTGARQRSCTGGPCKALIDIIMMYVAVLGRNQALFVLLCCCIWSAVTSIVLIPDTATQHIEPCPSRKFCITVFQRQ